MATIKSQLILETDKARAAVKSLLDTINKADGKLDLKLDTSKISKNVSNAAKDAQGQLTNLSQNSSSLFQNSWGNAISFAFGNLLARGIASAASSLGGFVSDSIKASAEIQKSLTSLEVVAPKFGIDGQDAIKSAQKLSKDLSIDYGVAAESLQNLLKSNVGLSQAEDLMKRFSNEAITGKSSTLDYGTAVQNLSFAFATNNSALGNNAGISENWTDIRERGIKVLKAQDKTMKDITKTLTAEQKQTLASINTGDIRISKLNEQQKDLIKYIGLIELTNLTLGSSERFQGGLVLKQIQLGQSVKDLQIAFGNLLAPALVEVIDILAPLIQKTAEWIGTLDPASISNFINALVDFKGEIAAVSFALLGAGLFSGVFKNLLTEVLNVESETRKNLDKILQNVFSFSKGITDIGLNNASRAFNDFYRSVSGSLQSAVNVVKARFVAIILATQKGVLTLLVKNKILAGLVSGSYFKLLAGSLNVKGIMAVISSKLSFIFLLMKAKILGGFAFIGGAQIATSFTALFSGIASTGAAILPFILTPFKFIGGALSKVLGLYLLKPILAIFGGLGKLLAPILLKALGGIAVFLAPIVVAIAAFGVLFGFAMAAIKRFNGTGGENKSLMDQLKAAYEKFTKDVLPVLIQKFQEFADFWNSNIQPVFDALLDIIINQLVNAFNKFKEVLPGVQANFQLVADKIKEAQPFLDTLGDAFNKLVEIFDVYLLPVLESFLDGVWANLVLAFDMFLPTLLLLWSSLQRLWDIIAPVLVPILIVLAGIVAGALYLAFVFLTTVFNNVVTVIIFLINSGLNILIIAIELLSSTFQVLGAIFKLVWDIIVDLFTNGGKNTGKIFNDFVAQLQKIWEELKPKLIEIAGNMWNSLVETVKALGKNIGDAFNNVTDAIMNVLKAVDLNETGRNMIQGLINGVKDMGKNLSNAIGGVVGGGVDWAKKTLGINSPSRVFRDQIGKQMIRGATIGVESEQANFNDAVNRVLDVNQVNSNITNNYNRIINNNNSNIFTFNSNGGGGFNVASQYAL